MSELLVNTIKKADGTGSLTVPAESGTVVVKDGSNDVTLNNITATGVYLGGTGAANYLDDYEEGTWTPVLADRNTGSVISDATYNTDFTGGYYTKVGRLVTLTGVFRLTSKGTVTSGNLAAIGGFPFTLAPADGGVGKQRTIAKTGVTADASGVLHFLDANTNYALLRATSDFAVTTLGSLDSTLYCQAICLSYFTND